jgi:hypothetical protein
MQQWLVAAAAARLETEAAGGLPRQRGLRSVVPLRQSGRAAAAWLLAVSLVTDEV